jgi:hypothetical protein
MSQQVNYPAGRLVNLILKIRNNPQGPVEEYKFKSGKK